jgi:hypothetical protein
VTPHCESEAQDHKTKAEEPNQNSAVISSGDLIGSVNILATWIRGIGEMNVTSGVMSRRKFFSENTILTTWTRETGETRYVFRYRTSLV